MCVQKKPYTVSAVYADGSGRLVAHCFAADAQAARDEILCQTGGGVIIASIFEGHLIEADEQVRFLADELNEIEADSICGGYARA
jgi:hypothetical protein